MGRPCSGRSITRWQSATPRSSSARSDDGATGVNVVARPSPGRRSGRGREPLSFAPGVRLHAGGGGQLSAPVSGGRRTRKHLKHGHTMRTMATLVAGLSLAWSGTALADEPLDTPRPVPLTRPDMKQLLEEMKSRKPRIPLPELTEEEKARLGDRGAGYEARLRALYTPGASDGRGGGFGKDNEPGMSLDYRFKTQLFWIVSRSNNCQYCLGHQESKLLGAGMSEDEIAALDGDWEQATPAERAAYVFARKFTVEPHRLTDADIDGLRPYYKDLQILEMILSMAGNNQINRWKEGVGVPQSPNGGGFRSKDGTRPPADRPTENHSYLTPPSDAFKSRVTKVAPLARDEKSGEPTRQTVCRRPALESRAELEKALAAARKRSPRLPLVDEGKAREVMGADWP